MKKVLIIILVLFFNATIIACVRTGVPPSRVLLQESETAFLGNVLDVQEIESKEAKLGRFVVTFGVETSLKGDYKKQVKILDYNTSCRFDFEKDENWIIFGGSEENNFYPVYMAYEFDKSEDQETLNELQKASQNKLPAEMQIRVVKSFNFLSNPPPYNIEIVGEKYTASFDSSEINFKINTIPSGKYKVRIKFDSKVEIVVFLYSNYKVISETPMIVEVDVNIKTNQLSFLYLEML